MDKILIHEVGLRDGLQAEKVTVPWKKKIRWIEGLFTSGIDLIQLGSLSTLKSAQMADTDELFTHLNAAGGSQRASSFRLWCSTKRP
jgi:hydroxymethylglutaryl-CoA lyase